MFNIFKSQPRQFMTEKQQQENLESQLSMTPQTIEQLREYGVDDSKKLKLEFFFFTNTSDKAKELNRLLSEKGYDSSFGVSASDTKQQVITGWTTPILMTLEDVLNWTTEMCEMGKATDCEFDGWGTNAT